VLSNDTQSLLLQTPYEKRLAIIAETFKQLQKDIGIDDDLLIFEGNPESAYQQLFDCIEPYLHNLLQSNAQRFARVLYKVDISESALNKKLLAFNTYSSRSPRIRSTKSKSTRIFGVCGVCSMTNHNLCTKTTRTRITRTT
jgi:hypothetical protein